MLIPLIVDFDHTVEKFALTVREERRHAVLRRAVCPPQNQRMDRSLARGLLSYVPSRMRRGGHADRDPRAAGAPAARGGPARGTAAERSLTMEDADEVTWSGFNAP